MTESGLSFPRSDFAHISPLLHMIPIAKAIELIDRNIHTLGAERVALADSVGRILAEDIVADTDLPPFDRSQMDGYALIARDTRKVPVDLHIAGESSAGNGWHETLKRGEAVRIMTGAPVPKGADTVQKIELAKELNGCVSFIDRVSKGQFIVPKGSEIRAGEVALRAGEQIRPEMIATLGAFGYAKVKVAKRPRVAIIPTGSEIVEIGKKPERDQIRDSNSVMLKVLCEQAGAIATIHLTVGDKLGNLVTAIKNASKTADIVVTTGGVSVGKYDLTKEALSKIGAAILFDKVALKPGKPAVFATKSRKGFFGLPGNPVSAAVTFQLFVRRAIMLMQSASNVSVERGFAVLNSPIKGNRLRDSYIPARFATAADGKLVAVPLPSVGSSDLVSFARAEALIVVPKGTTFSIDDVVDVLFL